MLQLLTFALAASTSFGLTLLVRRYVLRRAILDLPNDRSMHTTPVPRGGGLAIAAVTTAGLAVLASLGSVEPRHAIALIGGGVLVAAIGWIDDARGGIPPLVRATVQFAAAAWALVWLGGLPSVRIGAAAVDLGMTGSLLAAIGIVWWTNLYNFMDGIDGIAAGQAVTVGGFGALLLLLNTDGSIAAIAVLAAGAAAGFLILNWSPARIFMGDAGSGFLGFTFAVLALATERAQSMPLVAWLVLSGVFVFDSTVTLLRRGARGERLHTAHKSHAYQRLVASGYSHAAVTTGVLLFNTALAALALIGSLAARAMPYVLGSAVALLAIAYLIIERRRPMYPRRASTAYQHE